MNNTNIHKHLKDSDIRDFLGQQYDEAIKGSGLNSINWYEQEIERLQQKLKSARQIVAIRQLLESQGWASFDISDYYEAPFSFIGTEQEANNLMDRIKNEDSN